jgi:hypothetical protein
MKTRDEPLSGRLGLFAGIARREYTYTLPWQMNVLKHVLIRSPEWLFRRFAPTPARSEQAGPVPKVQA